MSAFGCLMGCGLSFGNSGLAPCRVASSIWLETCEATHLANKNSPGTGPGPSLGRKL